MKENEDLKGKFMVFKIFFKHKNLDDVLSFVSLYISYKQFYCDPSPYPL